MPRFEPDNSLGSLNHRLVKDIIRNQNAMQVT